MVKEEAGAAAAGAAPPGGGVHHGHRRQESMYAMTGLYSETASTEDGLNETQPPPPPASGSGGGTHSRGHSRNASAASHVGVKCHSRNPSAIIVESVLRGETKDRALPTYPSDLHEDHLADLKDCGILTCRPRFIQRFANIKVFVFLLSFLVTLQQALSSGYINSVITTIEKRFEIPSSLSGLIASSYEIGNVITVIFVSYLGSRRHIPVWIAIGSIIMGVGSMIFIVPHFIAEPHSAHTLANWSSDNICRGVPVQGQDMGLGRLSTGLSSPPLAPHNQLRGENCIKGSPSTALPVMLFLLAQLLLGCGGSPLFTLGTTYIDDHVRSESASLYIGCMYSMAAFGPVLGFLLGAYLLSFHMDSFTGTIVDIDPGDRRWVGMWWGGFLLCGLLLILVAVPFYAFPKTLQREKERIRLVEKNQQMNKPNTTTNNTTTTTGALSPGQSTAPVSATTQAAAAAATAATTAAPAAAAAVAASASHSATEQQTTGDSGYGKDVKDIPRSMWRLVCNPVYVVTCLGACMELIIVSGFVVFLPKYLETQFSLGKSQASVFTGSIAIPGACIGIFFGGCLLKRLELRPKGAVQFVLISNSICLACYGLLFFLGCDNVKMAGTTIPYFNSSKPEPFQVNLTAACNFGCECRMTDVEPVCGNNGLTYFSPCHAGCTAFSSKANYTNCACIHANFTVAGTSAASAPVAGIPSAAAAVANGPSSPAAPIAAPAEFAEVTVVPVATAGPCNSPCRTIFPFLILLFFMTFVVAITQMPLLMIVLRSVNEEERSFALGMQFVIFRLFGYIPAPILFGNVIDSTCLLWKSTCGEKGGRCLLYDIEQFRYKYVGICAGIKTMALVLFIIDWWLVRRRNLTKQSGVHLGELVGSIISLDKLFEERPGTLTLAAPPTMSSNDDVPTVSGLGGPCSRTPTTPSPMTTPETPGSVTLAVKSLATDDGSPAVPV